MVMFGLIIAGFVVWVAALMLARAFVLQSLWHWFIVPLGVHDIGFAHALGFGLIVSFLTSDLADAASSDKKELQSALVKPFIVYGAGYLLGLLFHSFM